MSQQAGVTVRTLRTQRGLSQHELAVLIGVTAPAVSQIERGKFRPRRETVQRLDDVLASGGAIARAFDYDFDARGDRVSRLAAEVERLAQVVALLASEAVDRIGAESELAERLAALEAGTARRPSA